MAAFARMTHRTMEWWSRWENDGRWRLSCDSSVCYTTAVALDFFAREPPDLYFRPDLCSGCEAK